LKFISKGRIRKLLGGEKEGKGEREGITGKHRRASGAPGSRNRKTRTGRDTVPLDNSTKKTF
jgi:hypothetical protein